MKEIAIFGGTFDPPTRAHEAIVDACLARKDIDEVWVMPSGQRQDKPDMLDDLTRLRMLSAMREGTFEDDKRLVISDFEMQLPQPSQTYATVAALDVAYPDNRFWFVLGADSYNDMPNWEQGARLQKTLGMLIVARVGTESPIERTHIRHMDIADTFGCVVSSTVVRETLRLGGDIEPLVSTSVAEFLLQQGCYKGV